MVGGEIDYRLQKLVDVLSGEPFSDHQYLKVVQQLGDLFGRFCVRLKLSSHPHLSSLFDDLLTDRVNAGVELGYRARTFGTRRDFLGKLGKQVVKSFHESSLPGHCGAAGQER